MTLTTFLHQFHFIRPWWFLALPPLIYLLLMLKRRRSPISTWKQLCDQELLPHILTGQTGSSRRWPFWLIGALLLLTIVSLAGPTWRKLPQPVYRAQSALVIVLDLSASMRAGDIKPNRLERAKHKVIDILRRRSEGQTALVVFSLEAFTVTPLTEDTNTIALMVPSLNEEIMPSQGSSPQLGIKQALELLRQAGDSHGDVLLIGDSVDSPGMRDAAKELFDKGYRLSILGVGTEEGAPIALTDGGFLKDRTGSIVVPKLNNESMREVASLGGGIYRNFSSGDSDINAFFNLWKSQLALANSEQAKLDKNFRADAWAEQGAWLVLPLLPFILLMFRRGLLLLLVLLVLPQARMAMASDWLEPLKNQDQQAQTLFQQKNYDGAAQTFKDRKWKSAAYYKAGEYQKALDQLRGYDDTDSVYNRGNILARLGKLKDAMTAYDEVLKRDPDYKDAKYNRDLIDKFLKQQQNKEPPEDNKQGDSSRKNQQSSSQGEQNQGDRQQNQSQSDNNDKSEQQQQAQGQSNDQQQQQDKQSQGGNKDKNQQQSDSQQAEQAPGGEEKSGQQENDNNLAQQDGDNNKDHSDALSHSQQNLDEKEKQRQEMEKAMRENQANAQPESQQSGETKQPPSANSAAQALADDSLTPEEKRKKRILEQWLRRVPDDPGGLLRRKFDYQSQTRGGQIKGVKPW